MTEKQIQKQITDFLKRTGIFYLKFNDHFQYGIPDLYVLINGRHVWVELKTESGKVKVLQKRMIEKINQSGGEAHVCRSMAEFLEIIGR